MVDLVCWDDVDPNAAEMDDPLEEALQDFYHRMIESPGSNIDDEDRGVGILQMLSGPLDGKLASKIDAEAKKDDRFTGAKTTVTPVAGEPGNYQVAIDLSPAGSLVLLANTQANTVSRVT